MAKPSIPNDQLALLYSVKTFMKNKTEICNNTSCSNCIFSSDRPYVDGLYDEDGGLSISLCDALNCIQDTVNDIL